MLQCSLENNLASVVEEKSFLTNENSKLEKKLSLQVEHYNQMKGRNDSNEQKLKETKNELDNLRLSFENVSNELEKVRKNESVTSKMLRETKELLKTSKNETEAEKNLLFEAKQTISQLEEEARIHEKERRYLHNTILELKGNIRVFARVRPLLKNEVEVESDFSSPNGLTILLPPNDPERRKLKLLGPCRDTLMGDKGEPSTWEFQFDGVFGPDRKQSDLFEEISQLVQSVLDGYKVCLFAYGQTGSGKTYTMEGGNDDESRGMIPRAVHQIFATIEAMKRTGWAFDVHATHLEVYNESVRDLLAHNSSKSLNIKHLKDGSSYVNGLSKHPLKSPNQVDVLLQKAAKVRATSATQCNDTSSRSHSVFQLHVNGVLSNGSEERRGCLTMVDLAGSERVVKSGAKGSLLKETQAINKSLAALGRVILALANNESHVPYRESKLTHLLQNSLGGTSKCLMLVNLSPAPQHQGETLCSLRFAQTVNHCDIGTAKANSRRENTIG